MSVLAYVRSENDGSLDYEGQVFGYAFELMQGVEEVVGRPNPMSYAVDEDALVSDEEIDEMLESVGDGDDEEELEDALYTDRGAYFDREEVLASLRAFRDYFRSHPDAREGKAIGSELAHDLSLMIDVVEGATGRVRIYLG